MNARTLILALAMSLLMWIVILAILCEAVTHASTTPPKGEIGTAVLVTKNAKLAPPWVCTMANRLEIFVDEDRIMYACECEALSTGHTCRWQVIGGVDARKMRRFSKQHRLIVYAWPAVTR